MIRWRPPQLDIINFQGGKLGVSAVPGSGKTQTLSGLAARLIIDGRLRDDQEILIVTLVNSAVENFSSRIERFLDPYHLVPGIGYRVRTLHGLAHDIVRERPDLVGLSTQFQILDERDSDAIIRDSAATWLRANSDISGLYLKGDIEPGYAQKIFSRDWPDLVTRLARSFISQAKDMQATPEIIHKKIALLNSPHPLLKLGMEIYHDYQRSLNYRNAVDFDDLIRLALQALQTDPDFLFRLQRRWPFILEDEAQDSSRLQEQILRMLAGDKGNWVRVGDPNQAIYETFTTANPQYLINFRAQPYVNKKDLPHSGRSTLSIIRLANFLNEWVQASYPVENLRSALTNPVILPTAPNDPQPNPPDNSKGINLVRLKLTPEEEIKKVVNSIRHWLPEHPAHTCAVLVPRNERGAEVVTELRRNGIEPIELLRSSQATRHASAVLAAVLNHLADPTSNHKLASLYHQIKSGYDANPEYQKLIRSTESILRTIRFTEDFLWPRPDCDWLASESFTELQADVREEVISFKKLLCRWHAAVLLPIDQLILTITQDLFEHPADLALTFKLALIMEQAVESHPDWDLPEIVSELEQIAHNERKFLGFTEEDTGFDPDLHKGKVVVATIHKAKGLEWDRVYLLSVNNYDFPSPENADSWISEKWFIRDQLNLEAETIEQLKALLTDDISGINLMEGEASKQARLDYASERLRLLYVGITRARRELMITWNSGRKGSCLPSTALSELFDYWETQNHAFAN